MYLVLHLVSNVCFQQFKKYLHSHVLIWMYYGQTAIRTKHGLSFQL